MSKKKKQPTCAALTLRKPGDDQICNLCRRLDDLSCDHIPPEACGNDVPMNVSTLFGASCEVKPMRARRHDGLRYRTLCVPCSRHLSILDRSLGDLVKQLRVFIWKLTELPETANVKIRPAAVLRSVLSHMLASKCEIDESEMDAHIRRYLNGSILDSGIRLYLWPYPFYDAVAAADFMFVDDVNGYSLDGIASVIKFFPLAFMVTNAKSMLPFDRLEQYAELSMTDVIEYTINMKMIMDATWPERPNRMLTVRGGKGLLNACSTIDGRFGRALSNTLVEPVPSESELLVRLEGDEALATPKSLAH